MRLTDSSPLSIKGNGLGFDLEPTMEEREQLAEAAQQFIKEQLDGLEYRYAVDTDADPGEGFLNHISWIASLCFGFTLVFLSPLPGQAENPARFLSSS